MRKDSTLPNTSGFRLDINRYQPITPNPQGWLWSEVLGMFLGIHDRELRYFSLEGILSPTPQESAQREIQKANQERAKAEQERIKAEQERIKAEQERFKAEEQLIRADLAEAKLQALQAKMRSLGISE